MLEEEDKKWIQNLIETHQHTGAESFKIDAGGSGGYTRSYKTSAYFWQNATHTINCGFLPKLIQIVSVSSDATVRSIVITNTEVKADLTFSTAGVRSTPSSADFTSVPVDCINTPVTNRIWGFIQNITATGFQIRIERIGGTVNGIYTLLVLG